MKYLILLPVVILISCVSPVPGGQPVSAELVWQEEFDYTGLPNPDIWTFETAGNDWGWGNGEDQFYTDGRRENAWVENGVCTITALKEQYAEGFGYTSARIITRGKAEWLYGRIEVSAKLPEGQGIWPAIWMMPTDEYYGGWPDSGEIDIMEYFGFMPDTVCGTVHMKDYNHKAGTSKGGRIVREGIHDGFHIYAVEWLPDRIDFYFDNEKYFTYQKKSEAWSKWPYDKPFHLRLNCAVGGDWMKENGGIDDSLFPHHFEIDYVRVYEFVYPGRHGLFLDAGPGGHIDMSPETPQFDPGERVSIKAVPDQGYRFESWYGDVAGSADELTVLMGRDKNATAVFVPRNELLKNGEFVRFSQGWNFWRDTDEVTASYGVSGGSCEINVTEAGQKKWQAQLTQDIPLEKGRTYVLSFSARSDRTRKLDAALVRDHAPYDSFWRKTVTVDTRWNRFSFTVVPDDGDPLSRVEFDMGDETGKVLLDNISLRISD